MAKVTIFNPKLELRRLEEKVANNKTQRICPSILLVPRAACKEAEWDEEALIAEAISRGEQRKEGEDVGEASWEDLKAKEPEEPVVIGRANVEDAQAFLRTGEVPTSQEVLRVTAAETDPEEPRGMPRVRFNLLEKESGEQKDVPGEQLRLFGVADDDLWDCPVCDSVNSVDEFICPSCSLDRNVIEARVLLMMSAIDTSDHTTKEHVEFLNSISMIKTRNDNWNVYLNAYIKHYKLKQEDMEGLKGDLPWEAKMETIPEAEKMSTDRDLAEALRQMAGEKKGPESTPDIFENALRDRSAKKETGAGEPSLVDIQSAFEEKAAEVADSDPRQRVIVSDELGWLCTECNRVWSLELKHCTICNKEYAAELEKKDEPVLEGETIPEGVDAAEEIKKIDHMKTADKALVLLHLKSKEKEK